MSVVELASGVLLALGTFFCVTGGLGLLRLPDFYSRAHAGGLADTLGATLILGGLVVPAKLEPVERIWMAGALQISRVTTPIVMGIVYYLVLTPIAVVVRRTKGNPLVHAEGETGYWFKSVKYSDNQNK